MTPRTLAVSLLIVSLVACTAPTRPDPAAGGEARAPRIALVLGGGAARGFAHVGVIRVLEQEKIPIDLVVGTSVGSLIGALYAHHANSFELEWTAFSLERTDIFDYSILNVGMGPVKGDKLEAFVAAKIPVNGIDELKLPFAAVATDLNRGTRVVLDKGPVARAVRASCSIPGVFQPVAHQGRLLVDGGVVDNVPVAVAREKGADIVIAVDIGESVVNYNIANLMDVTLQAVWIMFNANAEYKKRDADIMIQPRVGSVGMMDFSQKKPAMQAGIEAARAALPEIRARIAAWQTAESARLAAGR